MQTLNMPDWRRYLEVSPKLHETGEILLIDASGIDRIAASHHYAKRTNHTFKAAKTTALTDCKFGAILYTNFLMKQPHDSQVGWQLLKRNIDKVTILTADKGYDWWLFRQKLRAKGVKPVIKHREFGCMGIANKVLLGDTTYHQRSHIESPFFALRRRYGEGIRAQTWYGQFRELVLTCAVRNVELCLSD